VIAARGGVRADGKLPTGGAEPTFFSMITPKVEVLPNLDELAGAAAERIVLAGERAIADHNAFSLVLSGGSTPEKLYRLLADKRFRNRIDWSKVEIYFGDERCVPPEHADSNYRMANEALLSKVPLQLFNIHRMRGEIDPKEAAIEYGRMLKARFGIGGADLTLLGMGDDGHTASLYPGTEALQEKEHRCMPNYVEKLKSWRITLTAPFLNKSAEVLILVAGANKAARVAEILEGPVEPERLPTQLIRPTSGELIWMLDAAAAGMS
jgi:6-phosphogluconolactonase